MKAFLLQTGFLSPYGNLGVDISYLVALIATGMFFFGWRKARRGDGRGHRLMMISASALLLGYFFFYYLLRNLGGIIVEGKLGFGGPAWMAENILTPLLMVHLTFVLLVFFLVPYQLWLGRRAARHSDQGLKLSSGPLKMKNSVWLRVWLPVTVLFAAVGVYRCSNGYCWLFYAGAPLFFAMGIGLERLLERLAPAGDRRHRIVGVLTLSAILMLFATTTGMYAMLHLLYPHSAT